MTCQYAELHCHSNFSFLEATSDPEQLVEKACEQGLRVSVRTGGPAETAEFDELLWTFSDRSFVPHVVWPSEPEIAAATPVLVGSAGFPDHHRQVLINLAPDAPADFSAGIETRRTRSLRFTRI